MFYKKRQSSSFWSRLAFFNILEYRLTMTPSQCRAARGLLNWNQDDLARAARVRVVTVRNFENDRSVPQWATLDLIQRVSRMNPNEETAMAKATKKPRPWTKEDVRLLKSLVRERTKTSVVARKLKRTEGATRQKASVIGVRLVGSRLTKKAKSG
jgi:transcriptional regulator with XRE-family HTH domain